jgi:GxxExxY protein
MSIVKPEYKYSEITAKILAAAFEVHSIIGCGFHESVYHRALEIEFTLRNVAAISEKDIPLFYKNEKVGARRVDFLIEGKITVEIKAKLKLENSEIAQSINYLEAFNKEVGMLLNFGAKSLEFRRLFHPQLVRSFKSNQEKENR